MIDLYFSFSCTNSSVVDTDMLMFQGGQVFVCLFFGYFFFHDDGEAMVNFDFDLISVAPNGSSSNRQGKL